MDLEYYTVNETAKILKTTANTIRVKIREGKIPIFPWEGEPRIPKEFLENWYQDTTETFQERKLKQILEQKNEEIKQLKNTIRIMVKTGLEVEL